MALKFKSPTKNNQNIPQQFSHPHLSYSPVEANIPGLNIGIPLGGIPKITHVQPSIVRMPLAPIPLPGAGLPRAINFLADFSGCGTWRVIWPAHYLNAYQKAIVNDLSTMILEPRLYHDVKAVKLQRQATPVQLQFMQFLKEASKYYNFKMIYEIDDIVFSDDIPDYNRCKDAFKDEKIIESILNMMKMVDEICVPTQYMKDYYISKTGNKNITVIPNYPPKGWLDRFYNEIALYDSFQRNQKKPRIGACLSGTHVDQANRTGFKDDFFHIIDQIIKTRKEIKWVFLGSHPVQVFPYIKNNEMEFHKWVNLYDMPQKIKSLNLNATIAPLQDNIFNKSKSDIKLLEAGAMGIPCIAQDLVTYQNAAIKFSTGDDLIDQIKYLFSDVLVYSKISKQAYKYVIERWLEDHLDEHYELYFTNFGSAERKALLINNDL